MKYISLEKKLEKRGCLIHKKRVDKDFDTVVDCIATLCYEVARPKKSPAKIDKGPIQDPAEGLKIQ